jgi:hypothetical protein
VSWDTRRLLPLSPCSPVTFAVRAQKSLALFQGAPVYENLPTFNA